MILTPAHVTAAMAHERERILRYRVLVAASARPRNYIPLRCHVLALAALEVARDYGAEQLVLNRASAVLESYAQAAQAGETTPTRGAGGPPGPAGGPAPGGADPGGPGPRG